MKKITDYIKDFYQTDQEGLFGSIAIAIVGYLLFWHILPIILGLWKSIKQNLKMKLGSILAPGISMNSKTFGQQFAERNEFTNQNFNI